MRDPIEAILGALDRDPGGIVIIWSPQDAGIRDWLVSQVRSLAAERAPVEAHEVDEALQWPDRLVLLVPDPAAALDWLLSTVVPTWEPMPWTRVNEELKQGQAR